MNFRFFERSKFYFEKWPQTNFNYGAKQYSVMNFVHRWKFLTEVKNNISAYSTWTVKDSDTIYNVSERLYGSTHHFWLIMMMNDMIDPVFEWPMTETRLKMFVDSKYGASKRYTLHHYETEYSADINALPAGIIVDSDYPYNMKSISNFDYEAKLNDERREIKLMEPKYLQLVLLEKKSIVESEFRSMKRNGA